MRIDRVKLIAEMARQEIKSQELAEKAGMPEPTLQGLINHRSVKPATLGKVARALGVDPLEIMEQEE